MTVLEAVVSARAQLADLNVRQESLNDLDPRGLGTLQRRDDEDLRALEEHLPYCRCSDEPPVGIVGHSDPSASAF